MHGEKDFVIRPLKRQENYEDFKIELHNSEPEIADVLVPHCLYRGGCSEMQPCGFFEKFMRDFEKAKEK